jgi:hypothetical protein
MESSRISLLFPLPPVHFILELLLHPECYPLAWSTEVPRGLLLTAAEVGPTAQGFVGRCETSVTCV